MDQEERYLQAVTAGEAEASRVLVTLLFTDIVGSTKRAAELGDRAWTRLIEAHHAAVRELFARFDGREVDCAGDGFFATFGTASNAIGCGDVITASARSLGLEVRAGLHTGECERLGGRFRGIDLGCGGRRRDVKGRVPGEPRRAGIGASRSAALDSLVRASSGIARRQVPSGRRGRARSVGGGDRRRCRRAVRRCVRMTPCTSRRPWRSGAMTWSCVTWDERLAAAGRRAALDVVP